MSRAGVVAALDLEARSFRPKTRRRDGLFEVGDGTLVVVSGMGRAAAVGAAGALVDAGATALVRSLPLTMLRRWLIAAVKISRQ